MKYVQIFSGDQWYSMSESNVCFGEDINDYVEMKDDTVLYYKDGGELKSTTLRFGDENFLTLTALADNSSVCMLVYSNESYPDEVPEVSGLQYRRHVSAPWQNYTIGEQITLPSAGNYVQFRNNARILNKSHSYAYFSMTGKIAASGEVQSMLGYRGNAASNGLRLLFKDCESLIEPPEFSFVPLNASCYEYMFSGCTNLAHAPELPATNLAGYCYTGMFQNCKSLIEPPELPAKKLAPYCYEAMFWGCTSLARMPELPAKKSAHSCYANMFYLCRSLKEVELGLTSLGDWSCKNMFQSCSSLEKITVHFTKWHYGYNNASSVDFHATDDWLSGVKSTGVFRKPDALPVHTGVDYIPEGWTVEIIDEITEVDPPDDTALTLMAEKSGSTVKLFSYNMEIDSIQYRTGYNREWVPYTFGEEITLPLVGDYVQFQNTKSTLSKSSYNYAQFGLTGKIAASGNIQSMLNYSTECHDYCYYRLFYGQEELTAAPILSATKLDNGCYEEMFKDCTNLAHVPELPATKLEYRCYIGMFSGCSSLKEVKVNFTEWTSGCTIAWLRGVKKTGTFIKPASLPAVNGEDNIPEGWTIENF